MPINIGNTIKGAAYTTGAIVTSITCAFGAQVVSNWIDQNNLQTVENLLQEVQVVGSLNSLGGNNLVLAYSAYVR